MGLQKGKVKVQLGSGEIQDRAELNCSINSQKLSPLWVKLSVDYVSWKACLRLEPGGGKFLLSLGLRGFGEAELCGVMFMVTGIPVRRVGSS